MQPKSTKSLKSNTSRKRKSALSGVYEFPRASVEGCVIVPFALTACIPESAIRKFATDEPFVVHIDDGTVKFLVAYLPNSRHQERSLSSPAEM